MSDFMLMPASAFFSRDNPSLIHYIPLVDEQGRLIIDAGAVRSNVWANLFISAAGDYELSWEFITYLLQAYATAEGGARRDRWGHQPPWADQSLASSILQANFENSLRSTLNIFFNNWQAIGFLAFDDHELREQEINATIDRIAELNEMPMTLFSPIDTNAFICRTSGSFHERPHHSRGRGAADA